jgi:polyhydroxybutyrate depolymerase
MTLLSSLVLAVVLASSPKFTPGNHHYTLQVDGEERSYFVHVPPQYDGKKSFPVVLAFHGAETNGIIMAIHTGLNQKADEAGFIAVYPNGTGKSQLCLTWNVGWPENPTRSDDIAFVRKLLKDIESRAKVDPRRIYATGMSNGGVMCYLLAANLSDRIAAFAPVAGTMPTGQVAPKRPVPIMHIHGDADTFVPFDGFRKNSIKILAIQSVEETVQTWVKVDGCDKIPEIVNLPVKAKDGTTVERRIYPHGKNNTEVVLFIVHGGGHTWPGQALSVEFLGKSTLNILANDLLLDFFQKHPLPLRR